MSERISNAAPKRPKTAAKTVAKSPAKSAATRATPARKTKSAAEPRPYHHGNLREELIRCGKVRLHDEGLVDLSLRRIAADAGVSQVAPKHHFGNKEGLLAAIAASGFRDLTEFRFSRIRPGMSAEQRLRVLLSSYVVFATLHPALFHLMFAPEFKTPEVHSELNEVASQSYHLLSRAATEYLSEEGTPAASANSPTGDDIARMAWMCMHGVATLTIENRINPVGSPKYSREQLTNRMLDLVFAGMRALRTGV
jgi:AcrR family transcriptional regulator